MSNKFQDYVTSQAFALTLSKPMCKALEFIYLQKFKGVGLQVVTHIPQLASIHALQERGLVVFDGEWKITTAGVLMFAVLEHAGLVKSPGVQSNAA